ncbi:hypothetical protein Tco_0662398 [Tanacetum coccineum]
MGNPTSLPSLHSNCKMSYLRSSLRCSYKGFQVCSPKEYDKKGGAIALTRWIEKIENVIDNSGCSENQQVKYAASSFVNKASTWWNTQIQARGCEGTIGANHAGYTDRLHELAKLVSHLITPESSRIKRYEARLVPEIRGMLKATRPTTIEDAILRDRYLLTRQSAVHLEIINQAQSLCHLVTLPSCELATSGPTWYEHVAMDLVSQREIGTFTTIFKFHAIKQLAIKRRDEYGFVIRLCLVRVTFKISEATYDQDRSI